ncbi:MAG TPA: MFS transporter [Thermotogota bacterium]|nr:MFS transporter [Thermotogota bacterium]
MLHGFFSYLLLGLFSTGFSVAIPIIRAEFQLNYEAIGIVLTMNSIGFLLGSLCGGISVEKLSLRITNALGLILAPVGLLLLIASPTVILLGFGNFLVGFGCSFLETGIPPLATFFSKKTARVLNLLHSFFSLGALVSPVVFSILVFVGLSWRYLFGGMIVVFFLDLYLILTLKIEGEFRPSKIESKKSFRFLASPFFWIIGIGVAFYVASELAISSWAPTYAVDIFGYAAGTAAFLPTFFWIGLFIGRLVSAALVEKFSPYRWLLLVTLVGLPIVFLNQNPAQQAFYFYGLTFLAGLVHSSIYPTFQALLVQHINTGKGYALGVFASMGSLGGFASGYLVGTTSEKFGIRVGFLSIFFYFACTFICSFILYRMMRHRA